jgi:hypothetical protein
MHERIIKKVAIIGAVVFSCIFGYVTYHHPTHITVEPLKVKDSSVIKVNTESICNNTAKFVEMCYDYGYNDIDNVIELHNIIVKSSESDQSFAFVSRVCKNAFIAGKTDSKTGIKRDVYTISNEMCKEYLKSL